MISGKYHLIISRDFSFGKLQEDDPAPSKLQMNSSKSTFIFNRGRVNDEQRQDIQHIWTRLVVPISKTYDM